MSSPRPLPSRPRRLAPGALLLLALLAACSGDADNSDRCEDVACGPNAECDPDTGACRCVHGHIGDDPQNAGCAPDAPPPGCETGGCGENAECDQRRGRCVCDPGFVGNPEVRCEPAATCREEDCGEGAHCDRETDACVCNAGFRGDPAVRCVEERPCLDDSDCGRLAYCDTVGHACTCLPAADGDPLLGCALRSSCDEVDCGPHASCAVVEGEVGCACAEGYQGRLCESCAPGWIAHAVGSGCVPDPCDDFCNFRGLCTLDGALQPSCACEPGYSGERCLSCAEGYREIPFDSGECAPDPCLRNPCNDHGECQVQPDGSVHCACEPAYTGAGCDDCAAGWLEFPVGLGECIDDPCAPDPCGGRGACDFDERGAAVCQCVVGRAGARCEACAEGYVELPAGSGTCVPDPCAGEPCSGHGACSASAPGEASCACDPGYSGARCQGCAAGSVETPAGSGVCLDDACDPDPCTGHGVCSRDDAGGFSCACDEGRAGADCSGCAPGLIFDPAGGDSCIDDPCAPNPCGAHGACRVGSTGLAACTCERGYRGQHCETCAAGYAELPAGSGTCVDDPCRPDPCHGHGACSATQPGAFSCACELEYVGTTCDACAPGHIEDPRAAGDCLDDPCDPDVCGEHGGCAVDGAGRGLCVCEPGWDGEFCDGCAPGFSEEPPGSGICAASACAPQTCSGHGACSEAEGSVSCACDEGYAGARCELCDEGWLRFPEGSSRCIADPCAALDCGVHGACAVDESGAGGCACDAGYAGASCAGCAGGHIPDPEDGARCIEDPCGGVVCAGGAPICNDRHDAVVQRFGTCEPLGEGLHECPESVEPCEVGFCLDGVCRVARRAAAGEIVLSELRFGASAAVELQSRAAEPLRVDGVLVARPGGTVVVGGGAGAPIVLEAGARLVVDLSAVGLDPEGDALRLREGEVVLDDVVWSGDLPRVAGRSLTLSPAALEGDAAALNDDPAHWCPAQAGAHSLGAANAPCAPDWCGLMRPALLEAGAGADAPAVFAQVYEAGFTDAADGSPHLRVELGFGADGTLPDDASWRWFAAALNPVFPAGQDHDEVQARFPAAALSAGEHDVAARVSLDAGLSWTWCDLDGSSAGGYTPAQAGRLVVAE